MKQESFDFQYRFHQAGQGLFASGTVIAIQEHKELPPYHWVFDCGSTSTVQIKPIVERFRDFIISTKLDLLCISHFDKDHVSGLGDLLKNLDVDTVVLPYWSTIERLILLASADNPDSDYIEFLENPVAFVIDRAKTIRRIIMLGGPADMPPDDRNQSDTPNDFPDEKWNLKFEQESRHGRTELPPETLQLLAERGIVLELYGEHLRGFASYNGSNTYWEFLFHHKPIDSALIESIRSQIEELIPHAGTIFDPDTVKLKAILAIYKASLPKGETVNSTSLCVYSGPSLDADEFWMTQPLPQPTFGFRRRGWHEYLAHDMCAVSILYAGDANFKVKANRDELIRFLSVERWRRIAILQVPHHGSRANWETGSSADFFHCYSVFCADERLRRPGHPHREVVLDLVHRCPILVNKSVGWAWQGRALFSQFRLSQHS